MQTHPRRSGPRPRTTPSHPKHLLPFRAPHQHRYYPALNLQTTWHHHPPTPTPNDGIRINPLPEPPSIRRHQAVDSRFNMPTNGAHSAKPAQNLGLIVNSRDIDGNIWSHKLPGLILYACTLIPDRYHPPRPTLGGRPARRMPLVPFRKRASTRKRQVQRTGSKDFEPTQHLELLRNEKDTACTRHYRSERQRFRG